MLVTRLDVTILVASGHAVIGWIPRFQRSLELGGRPHALLVLLVEEILALIFRDMIEERWLWGFHGGLDLLPRLVLNMFLILGLRGHANRLRVYSLH
jgi:hypothetical protein